MSKIDFSRIVTAAERSAQAEAEDLKRRTAEAVAFLASSDWLVVRQAETGEPIPEDISAARAAARKLLST